MNNLQQELQKAKLLSGAGPSTSAATSKNSSKLITENDKLRKDLKKVRQHWQVRVVLPQLLL